MIQIAPSILSADFCRLGDQVREALEAGVSRIHVDVMDGVFVPNITVGPLVVKCLAPLVQSYQALLEVHLMIVQPERYLDDFAEAGAGMLIVHVETCPHLHRTLQSIRELKVRPGVTLNPGTPLGTLEEILPEVEQVLLMTVNPGFGGQDFIPSSLERIARLKAMLQDRDLQGIEIEVDGGIHPGTIAAVAQAGATIAVAGSAVFNNHATVAENLAKLRAAARP